MFISMSTIIGAVLFGGFLLWLHIEQSTAKRRKEELEREYARKEADRLARIKDKYSQP
ncbi:hypothetical protein [Mesorhizobium sp. M0698]|uniref:hypothetical protein n=1 Tax=Mesorhizobium sp. M0698 TaxID=2956987 RepID=UPI00333D6243